MAKSSKVTPKGKTPLAARGNAQADALMTLLASLGQSEPNHELDRAQEKAFDAMAARTSKKRVALARQALAISPLCADAYCVLADEAEDAEAALALYRQAVEAGENALGEAAFDEDAGFFWGLLETRPYMRARQSLASLLWERGERDVAVEHYQDMLRLNPNDNQGIRYMLMDALLELGRDEPAAALLKRYKDDGSAAWDWSKALLTFRRKGNTALARKALAQAFISNEHVAGYLLGRKALPAEMPDFIGFGDENEAVAYVSDALAAWRATEKALQWVEAGALEGATPPPGAAGNPDTAKATPEDRIDDAVLALLLLGLHEGDRAWKSFDWDAMDRLHAKGVISNPASKTKSVVFSDEGLQRARALHEKLFGDDAGREA